MRFLLDTQAFFWLIQPDYRVPSHIADALTPASEVVVSDVSAFEAALKVRLGKFDAARELVVGWSASLASIDASPLSLDTRHAITAGSLEWPHRDPFDRLIVGQAIVEGLTLVTSDRVVQRAPGVDVLVW